VEIANGGAAAAALAGGDNPGGAAGTTTTTVTPTPGGTGTTQANPWYHDAPDELKGVVEKKGWKGAGDALKSYVELEKAFGGDKIVLPKEAADEAGWNTVYDRLGRPKTPEEYKFPEGTDPAITKALAPELHKLGMNQRQVEALAKIDLQRNQEAANAELQRQQTDQRNGMQKLESEWGAKFNENIEVNRRAMRNLGISVDDANKAMASMGTEKFMRLLNLAGVSAREDNSAGLGESNLGFGMTPNRAKAELAEKGAELRSRAQKGGSDGLAAKQSLDRLYKVAYPGTQT
jgi:hypothetical protein